MGPCSISERLCDQNIRHNVGSLEQHNTEPKAMF